MSRTAEAEKAAWIGIGVEPQPFDLRDARSNQPMNDIGFEIEVRPPASDVGEESLVCSVELDEARSKGLVDLIGSLGNRRADHGMDILAPSPEALHGVDGCIGDTCKSAAPAGVGSADDARIAISQQDGGAIRSKNPEKEIGGVSYHCVGTRALPERPRTVGDNDFA